MKDNTQITITVSEDNRECSFKYSLSQAKSFIEGKEAYHIICLDNLLKQLDGFNQKFGIDYEGAKKLVVEKRKKFEEDMQLTLTRPIFPANNTQNKQ